MPSVCINTLSNNVFKYKNHETHRHGGQMQPSPGEGRDPPWVHLAAQGYIPTMAMPFKDAWAATWVHSGDVWASNAVGGYVWVHDPAPAGFCDDVSCSCYHGGTYRDP